MSMLPTFRTLSVVGALLGLLACSDPGEGANLAGDSTVQADLTANTQGSLTARVNTQACLDVVGGSTQSGAAVQMWACHGGSNQQWKVKQNSVEIYGNLCLSASGTANGSPVVVVTCNASDAAQGWTVNGAELINTASNKCLDVTNGGTANGTRLQIWDCHKGNINQTWLMPNEKPLPGAAPLPAPDAPRGLLALNANPGLCLDVVDVSTQSGAAVQVWSCNGGANNQQWAVQNDSVQVYGTLCLSATGTGNGSRVVVATCNGSDAAQRWTVSGAQLINAASNRCLDLIDGNRANGTRLQIWDCYGGSANQSWRMPNQTGQGGASPAPPAPAPQTPVGNAGPGNVWAAVDQPVNFSDWGIWGGFWAMPLKQLLALHPQLGRYQQAFVTAGGQANPPIPPQLLVAICLQESSGGLDWSGYGGPFQFTYDPSWAYYGPPGGDRNDMAAAAIGAANYIADELRMKNGDLNAALRVYNGPIGQGGKASYQSEIQRWMQGELVYGPGV